MLSIIIIIKTSQDSQDIFSLTFSAQFEPLFLLLESIVKFDIADM